MSLPAGRLTGPEDGARRRSANPEQIRDDLIDAAAAYAPEIGDLIRLYYRDVPAEEILGDDPVDLVGAVRSHLQLAKDRMSGRPAVRLLNPTGLEDGWTSENTVVQVVTDDMPYLVDSVAAEFARDGVQVARVIYPIVVVNRDLTGELAEVHLGADPADPPANSVAESWLYFDIDLVTDPNRARELDNRLSSVLGDVREVVEDTDKMTETARRLADELDGNPPRLPGHEVAEGARLLRWLADGHFTFLGYRRYELIDNPHPDSDEPALRAVLATGLGVLRQDSLAARSLTAGPDTAASALAPTLLVLTMASAPSTVYRPVYPYYVGVKTFDDKANVIGEHRFLGMFTIAALHDNVLDIPVVGGRVREVIRRAGFPMESFAGQRMLEVLQNWPLEDLFSADTDSLYSTTTGAIRLSDRRRLRLFLRRDPYGRFFSCLVYLPRDRYTTRSRLAMQEVLLEELEGTQLEYSARIGETALAQVHLIVHTDPVQQIEPDIQHIQERLTEAVRTWDDRMVEAILAERRERAGDGGVAIGLLVEESAGEQGQRFAAVFPEGYKEDFTALEALADLRALESLTDEGDLSMSFYLPADAEAGERRFKLYLRGVGTRLSTVLPLLQAMGVEVVDERPYELRREDGGRSWIYDFGLYIEQHILSGLELDGHETDLRARFEDTFRASWNGDCEVDAFNGLVLRAGLTWRQAVVLRAYSRYLRHTGTAFSQDYIQTTLLTHPAIATKLLRLFELRFDLYPAEAGREAATAELVAELGLMIGSVTGLDEDRILRRLMSVILATLRTNYHVTDGDGNSRQYLALKLDPSAVPELPEPRPKYEIFVYSPRIEGVHLRFGDVARGGLRWSDRREDFRTEILGLVKAQAVKNAVIVPVGAKGGFVVKRPPTATGDPGLDRDAQLNEGIACYRMFISGLLDVTD
ncbi:NAD-glutamate dehydrogenase domain-containing protein, partial [Amycolatopsis japonica]|uniref:NAD-glutamate dehydrogenase domain-containing protein n=1 Tax=Amycolatopsis japonica TaxID=208439 RepID=UPI0037A5EAA8